MSSETELLLRYLDGELSPDEAARFRARLAESPALRQKLAEMRRVGELLRLWAGGAEARAGDLLEPTLRAAAAERHKSRTFAGSLAVALAIVLLSLSSPAGFTAPHAAKVPAANAPRALVESAAIERIDAGQKQAQVFVVGAAATTVVWLADEAEPDFTQAEPGPG